MHSLLKTGIIKGRNKKCKAPKYWKQQGGKTEVESPDKFPPPTDFIWTTLATRHGREKNVCIRLSSSIQLSRHSRITLIFTNNLMQLRPSCLRDSRSTKVLLCHSRV